VFEVKENGNYRIKKVTKEHTHSLINYILKLNLD